MKWDEFIESTYSYNYFKIRRRLSKEYNSNELDDAVISEMSKIRYNAKRDGLDIYAKFNSMGLIDIGFQGQTTLEQLQEYLPPTMLTVGVLGYGLPDMNLQNLEPEMVYKMYASVVLDDMGSKLAKAVSDKYQKHTEKIIFGLWNDINMNSGVFKDSIPIKCTFTVGRLDKYDYEGKGNINICGHVEVDAKYTVLNSAIEKLEWIVR